MIKSVLKAVDILELFSPERPIMTLSEISDTLDMNKSSAHTMLATLVSRGLIEKNGDAYVLGKSLISLTQGILVNVDIRDRAAPFLRELAEHCKETVYLTVPDGYYCLYIYAIESSHRLQARSAIGNRVPYHCTSVGRALLAYMPKERVEEIIRVAGLPRFSPLTITTREELFAELEKIRTQGYGTDFGQHDENVYCIGAPIFNQRSQVIASCSLASLRKEIVTDKLEIYANYLLFTTQEISRRMGYVYDKSSYQNILENPFRKERSPM
jgi:DNA-binding IclR family transcriptional regulator